MIWQKMQLEASISLFSEYKKQGCETALLKMD
jgi:hypothetical protein